MIIDFKTMFLEHWAIFSTSKTEVDFSGVSKEKWKEAGHWPATVPPFFPLVARCVARKEEGQYLLLYNDALVLTDELSIEILKLCNGFNPPKVIKKAISENPIFTGIDHIEEKVENVLTNAGKYGIINWIPFSQPHIDRM